MRLLVAIISVYLLGFLTFTLLARFDHSMWWDNAYFIWQALCYGSVGTWAYIYHTGNADVKKLSIGVYLLSYVLFAWEIVSSVKGWNINNKSAVFAGYLIVIGVTGLTFCQAVYRLNKD